MMLGFLACVWISSILCGHVNGYLTELGDFAFYFPTKGVNDYVNIWGMPSLKQFTLCFWMKSSAGNDGTVLSYAVPGQHNELLFFDHTNINMYIGGQGRPLGISSANDGKWHHICASWRSSDGAWQGYKDGALTKSGTGFRRGYTIKGGGSLTLGQEQDAVGSRFDSNQAFIGTLSNLNLWSLILPVEKMKDLSKSCKQDWGGDGDVYKWIDFLYGIRGGTRIVMPSPCPR
ncbi:neuronal pentraxin-2-like [Porites lutea]|uniref:neuronal pentraxin-2-like n=1 Tax=Porites lutea TaxID=51062 RepID=UPI003CC5148F